MNPIGCTALYLSLTVGAIACNGVFKDSIEEPIKPEARHIHLEGEDFIALGDNGTGKEPQYEVARAMERHCEKAENKCDFAVILGDIIYENGVKDIKDKQFYTKFEKPYKDLDFVFYPALGNHDHRGSWQAMTDYESERWQMPARYYHLQTELADIYAIDTEKFDKAQRSWLKDSLKKSKKTWKFVYGHHPVYSNGLHGDNLAMKSKLKPILEKYDVDMYLAGHDHHFELIHKSDMKQLVSGSGGKVRSHFAGKGGTLFSRSALGFSFFDLEADSFRLDLIDKDNKRIFTKTYSK